MPTLSQMTQDELKGFIENTIEKKFQEMQTQAIKLSQGPNKNAPSVDEWQSDFFKTFGSFKDYPLQRFPQDEPEERLLLE